MKRVLESRVGAEKQTVGELEYIAVVTPRQTHTRGEPVRSANQTGRVFGAAESAKATRD
jgi:hypothetical protein